jgi:hypothetical protein
MSTFAYVRVQCDRDSVRLKDEYANNLWSPTVELLTAIEC